MPEIVPRPSLIANVGVTVPRSGSISPARSAPRSRGGRDRAARHTVRVRAQRDQLRRVFSVVLIGWRGYTPPVVSREPFAAATRAGLRDVDPLRHRAPARPPAVALRHPGQRTLGPAARPGASTSSSARQSYGYGLLLAALGVGAIGGAFVIPHARAAPSGSTGPLMVSIAVYGIGIAVTALLPTLAVTLPVLVRGGRRLDRGHRHPQRHGPDVPAGLGPHPRACPSTSWSCSGGRPWVQLSQARPARRSGPRRPWQQPGSSWSSSPPSSCCGRSRRRPARAVLWHPSR